MVEPDALAPGTDPAAAAVPLCRSDALAERGRAHVWDVRVGGQPTRAFALRVDGRVVAYVNRCLHVPVELDWQPGEFFDAERMYIVCSVHGAMYAPQDGRCIGGPCGRGRLIQLKIDEREGQVHWYPSTLVQPAATGRPAFSASSAASPMTGADPAAESPP